MGSPLSGLLADIFLNNFENKYIINNKLKSNNAIICKADKGNSIVIIYEQQYIQKVYDFINSNSNIEELKNDPTKFYKQKINSTIEQCKNLFKNNGTRRYLKTINPKAPQFTGLLKIHKQDTPIRPLVDFTTAPGYKLAKKVEK